MKLFCILDKGFPKINCFMMQGQKNVGKIYWTQSLLADVVGQTVQSSDFAWQKCFNKVIPIPELFLTKPDYFEECRKIFEGPETTISVQNKETKLLVLYSNNLDLQFLTMEVQ